MSVPPGFFRHTMDLYATDGSWTGGNGVPTWVMRDANGAVIKHLQGRQLPLSRAKGQWAQLIQTDILPDNIATIQCHLSLLWIPSGTTLYFSNAQFTQVDMSK